MKRQRRRFPLPREHGAWAVVLVPFAVGSFFSTQPTIELFLLFVAVMGFFLAHVPVRIMIRERTGQSRNQTQMREERRWAAITLGIASIAGMVLLNRGFLFLGVIAAAGVLSFFGNLVLMRKNSPSLVADLVAVLGLTLSGPAAYYVGTGSLDERAFVLWFSFTLFFGSGFVYVQMKIRASSLKKSSLTWKERLTLGRSNLLYHLTAIGCMAILARVSGSDILLVAAFAPMTLHAFMGTIRMTPQTRFKRLGFLLVGQSALFGAMLLAIGL